MNKLKTILYVLALPFIVSFLTFIYIMNDIVNYFMIELPEHFRWEFKKIKKIEGEE